MIYINPFIFMGLDNASNPNAKNSNTEHIEKYRFSNSIIEFVCQLFDLDVEMIKSKSRKKEFTFPRYICFALIKSNTSLSLSSIGYLFSKRDHATIIHGIKEFHKLSDEKFGDKSFIKMVKQLEECVQLKNIELFQGTQRKANNNKIVMPDPIDVLDQNQINLIDSIKEVEQTNK